MAIKTNTDLRRSKRVFTKLCEMFVSVQAIGVLTTDSSRR